MSICPIDLRPLEETDKWPSGGLVGNAFWNYWRCRAAGMQRERDRERQSVLRSSASSRWETETCCIGSVWEQTADRSAVIVTQIIVRWAELREATSPKRCPRVIATHVLVKEEERGGWRAAASWLCHMFFFLDGMFAANCFWRWWDFKKRKEKKNRMRLRRGGAGERGDGRVSPLKSWRAAGGSRGERTRLCSVGCAVREVFKKKGKGKRKIAWEQDVIKRTWRWTKYLMPWPESQFSPFYELKYVLKGTK